MSSNMRMHREHIQPAFLVRHVEFRREDLLNQVWGRQRAIARTKVWKVIQDALDGQLDHTRGLPVDKNLVGIVARHQAAVIQKPSVLDLLHGEPAEMRSLSYRSSSRHLRQVIDRLRQQALFFSL